MGCGGSKSTSDVVTTTQPGESGLVPKPEHEVDPSIASKESFNEHYTLGKKLGSGTFSVVREATHKSTGQRYAVKCIKKHGLTKEDVDALAAEVAILKQMDHPNIMILFDFFSEDRMYYLVTELMEGGELFDRIVEKEFYTEKEARDVVKLVLTAIKYCHDRNVVHRDLKPENLLLTSKQDDASIKIADFGFAKKMSLNSDGGLETACGTPGYVAPEILEGKPYGEAVDIWSIGVITYILLCGYPPFHHENHNVLFKMIKKGVYQFDSPYWDEISEDAKDLIRKMLIVAPGERSTAGELLQHPWLTGKNISSVPLTSALEELKRFNARRKFKAAVNTVTAARHIQSAFQVKRSSTETVEKQDDGQSTVKTVTTTEVTVEKPNPAEGTKDTGEFAKGPTDAAKEAVTQAVENGTGTNGAHAAP